MVLMCSLLLVVYSINNLFILQREEKQIRTKRGKFDCACCKVMLESLGTTRQLMGIYYHENYEVVTHDVLFERKRKKRKRQWICRLTCDVCSPFFFKFMWTWWGGGGLMPTVTAVGGLVVSWFLINQMVVKLGPVNCVFMGAGWGLVSSLIFAS